MPESRRRDAYRHLPIKARARNEIRRQSFNLQPELYDAVRPKYPEALFDDCIRLSHMPVHGRILEIGPGTGQATVPLARRGHSVLGIELGDRMAELCRENCRAYPNVTILNMAFEDWPVAEAAFDMVFAATAFHWIRPGTGFRRAAQALKTSGSLALCWNFREVPDDEFHQALRKLYRRYVPRLADTRPPEERIRRQQQKITGSGLFAAPTVLRYPWECTYPADEYIRQLRTQSDHATLEPSVQAVLLKEIHTLVMRLGGSVLRRSVAALFLARKRMGTLPPRLCPHRVASRLDFRQQSG
jgi:SAM-dependent methyltransferase